MSKIVIKVVGRATIKTRQEFPRQKQKHYGAKRGRGSYQRAEGKRASNHDCQSTNVVLLFFKN